MRRSVPFPRTLLMVALLATAAGCACRHGGRGFVAAAPGEAWVRTELIFGLGLKDGGTVDAKTWQEFLDAEVTPRFPDGLTVVDGAGQWRDAAGKVTAESSKILILYHPPDPSTGPKLEAIRAAYQARFHQESVLRATSSAKVSF